MRVLVAPALNLIKGEIMSPAATVFAVVNVVLASYLCDVLEMVGIDMPALFSLVAVRVPLPSVCANL